MRAAGEQTSHRRWALRVPKHPLPAAPLVPSFWGWWQHKSASHWGLGLHFVGQWIAGWGSNAMSFRPDSPRTPLLSLHFSWYQQTERWEHYWKHRGVFVYCQHKMLLLFSTIPPSQRAPPPPKKPLLRDDGFTPFVRFHDYSLTISGGRSTQLIYLSKIATPHNNQQQTQIKVLLLKFHLKGL